MHFLMTPACSAQGLQCISHASTTHCAVRIGLHGLPRGPDACLDHVEGAPRAGFVRFCQCMVQVGGHQAGFRQGLWHLFEYWAEAVKELTMRGSV